MTTNWIDVSNNLKKLHTDFNFYYEVTKHSIEFYTSDPKYHKKLHASKWKYYFKPAFIIARTGLIHNCKTKKDIAIAPLKSAEDYDNAFRKLYQYKMNQETDKWKTRLKKGTHQYADVPFLILNRINPKLASIQKIGIFDE